MLVKFTIQNISTMTNNVTILEAIRNIATASAGVDPVQPTSCDNWQVISNSEAGGWNVINDDTAAALSVAGTYTDCLMLNADTPKTVYDGRTKCMRFTLKNSTTDGITTYASILNSSDEIITSQLLHNGNTSSYHTPYNWYSVYPYLLRFTVAVTSQYLWIFMERNDATYSVSNYNGLQDRKIVGISDLSNETAWDYLEISQHVPVGGMYTNGANSSYSMSSHGSTLNSTYYSYGDHGMYPKTYVLYNQDEYTDAPFNSLFTTTYGTGQNVTPTNIAHNYGSELYNLSISGSNLRSGWDENGIERPQVRPFTTGRWEYGETVRKTYGLTLVGVQRNANRQSIEQKHGSVIKVNGTKIMLFNQAGCVFGIEVK